MTSGETRITAGPAPEEDVLRSDWPPSPPTQLGGAGPPGSRKYDVRFILERGDGGDGGMEQSVDDCKVFSRQPTRFQTGRRLPVGGALLAAVLAPGLAGANRRLMALACSPSSCQAVASRDVPVS